MVISFPDRTYEGVEPKEEPMWGENPAVSVINPRCLTPPEDGFLGLDGTDDFLPVLESDLFQFPEEEYPGLAPFNFNPFIKNNVFISSATSDSNVHKGQDLGEAALQDHDYTSPTAVEIQELHQKYFDSLLCLTRIPSPPPSPDLRPVEVSKIFPAHIFTAQITPKPRPAPITLKIPAPQITSQPEQTKRIRTKRKYTKRATPYKRVSRRPQPVKSEKCEPEIAVDMNKLSKNNQEKVRRCNLRQSFDRLRNLVFLDNEKKASNLTVLNRAVESIALLKKNAKLKERLRLLEEIEVVHVD